MRLISDELLSTSVGDARYKTLEAIIAPTLLNGWVNYDTAIRAPAGYYKTPQNELVVQGFIKNGTIGLSAWVTAVGYRIEKDVEAVPAVSNALFAYLTLESNGNVRPQVGSNVWFAMPRTPMRLP
jgi:hypothetical protein